MTRKKYIKQLMALGVQRNDAAGFVSTYMAIKAAGKERMLPAIMQPIPAPPLNRTRYDLREFAATIRHSDEYVFQYVPSEQDVYTELAKELGMALLSAGAIITTRQQLPPTPWNRAGCVEYRATIKVGMEV